MRSVPSRLGKQEDEQDEDDTMQGNVEPPEVAPTAVVCDRSRNDGTDLAEVSIRPARLTRMHTIKEPK